MIIIITIFVIIVNININITIIFRKSQGFSLLGHCCLLLTFVLSLILIMLLMYWMVSDVTIKLLRHIGLLEADEDKIRKIRPKGTQVRMLYVPREAIRP